MKRKDLLAWAAHFSRKKPGPQCSTPQVLMWLCLFELAGMLE